jgi:4-aminobutyrate aminotransferase/(S)-3-amino-2-methylpropionate transaminase
VMPTATGTEAVESALKIARAATGGRAVMSFPRAFHGKTAGALSLSSRPDLRKYSVLSGGIIGPELPSPAQDATDFLDKLSEALDVRAEGPFAAVIVEPVQVTEVSTRLNPRSSTTLRCAYMRLERSSSSTRFTRASDAPGECSTAMSWPYHRT